VASPPIGTAWALGPPLDTWGHDDARCSAAGPLVPAARRVVDKGATRCGKHYEIEVVLRMSSLLCPKQRRASRRLAFQGERTRQCRRRGLPVLTGWI